MKKDGHPRLAHFAIFVLFIIVMARGFTFTNNNHLPLSNAQLSTNLISYWKLDNNANDSVGNTNGSLVGSPSFVTGHTDGAISLNGTNEHVNLGESFNTLDYPFTVTAWINMKGDSNSGPDSPIFATDDQDYYTGFQLMVDTEDSTPTYQLVADLMNGQGNGSDYRASKTSPMTDVVPLNEWTYVAAAVNGPNAGDITLYINGVDVGGYVTGTADPSSLNPLPHALNAPATIGKRGTGGGGNFNGLIDEVRVYNKKLSQAEIVAAASSVFIPVPTVNILAIPGSMTAPLNDSIVGWTVKGPLSSCVPTATPANNNWTGPSGPSSISAYSNYTDLDALQGCIGKSLSLFPACEAADIEPKDGLVDSNDEFLFTAFVNRYDLDGDGDFDSTGDLAILKSCFFKTGPPWNPTTCAASDLNADNVINFADLAIFKQNLGKYNFNGSSYFSVDKVSTPPQTGFVNTGLLAFVDHLFSLRCTGLGGENTGVASIVRFIPTQCSDGIDNDGDGKIDFTPPPGKTKDPGCLSATDNDERNPICGNNRCEIWLGELSFGPRACPADCPSYIREK